MQNKRILLMTGVMVGAALAGGCGRSVMVIAHRGESSRAPENTLAAFRAGIEAGADYVELDTRTSADGTLYVLHDDTLDRTTNARELLGGQKIALKKTHDRDVDRLDAGSWFDPRFAGERVPTLAAALDTIQAKSKTLLERKDGSAEAHARILVEKKLVNRLIVQSFDWEFLADLHRRLPEQPLWALGSKDLDDDRLDALIATGAKAAAWEHAAITPEFVRRLKARGLCVVAWTADKPEDWQRLIDCGIEGIITNKPRELRAWLTERGMPSTTEKPRPPCD